MCRYCDPIIPFLGNNCWDYCDPILHFCGATIHETMLPLSARGSTKLVNKQSGGLLLDMAPVGALYFTFILG